MYGMAATRKPSGGVFRREQPQGFSVHAILNRSRALDRIYKTRFIIPNMQRILSSLLLDSWGKADAPQQILKARV